MESVLEAPGADWTLLKWQTEYYTYSKLPFSSLVGYTGYPIEKYVGWMATSSYFIFNISGVIPLLENHFLYLKILPRNLWIDLCFYV